MRLLRLAYANQLLQCDRSIRERTRIGSSKMQLFEPDPNLPRDVKQFEPAEIEGWLAQGTITQHVVPELANHVKFLTAVAREEARQGELTIALALQLYYRLQRRFPEKLEDLIGPCVEALPVDPFRKEVATFHYRREENGATIWSVGPDGTDEQGEKESPSQEDPGDILMRVKSPAASAEKE